MIGIYKYKDLKYNWVEIIIKYWNLIVVFYYYIFSILLSVLIYFKNLFKTFKYLILFYLKFRNLFFLWSIIFLYIIFKTIKNIFYHYFYNLFANSKLICNFYNLFYFI